MTTHVTRVSVILYSCLQDFIEIDGQLLAIGSNNRSDERASIASLA